VKANTALTVRDLSHDEKVGISQRTLKKHDVAIILLHWFNAASWFILLVTGLALFSGGSLNITPDSYNRFIIDIFRGKANLIQFHIFWATSWSMVIAFYLIFGIRSHVMGVRDMILLHQDDVRWLMIKPLKILGLSKESLPPQGIYNAGQKLFAWVVFTMVPLVIASGFIMGYSLFSPSFVRWAILIHGVSVSVVVAGLIVHIYMAAILPEEKPAFFSMFTGRVNSFFAYQHHRKFWQRRVTQEFVWNRDHKINFKDNRNLIRFSTEVNNDFEKLADQYQAQRDSRYLKKAYANPYFIGVMLGLLLCVTFYLMGYGLGGSGGLARMEASIFEVIASDWTTAHPYWGKYFSGGKNPLLSFGVLLTLGVFFGGWFSGSLSNRRKFRLEKGKHITGKQRILFALAGGVLVGFAARLARGCTSGLALTGGASMAVAGWVFFIMFFVGGFVTAYLVRRIWL
jgi:formate dehydrogenase gamma subunit